MVLSNSKHELFAQFVSSGLTAVESYVKAGYAPAGAWTNASRLIANDRISARIKELQTAVAERVVDLAVRKRNWRVAMLQNIVDRSLATIQARSVMYANQMGESQRKLAQDLRAEKAAIGLGFFEVDDIGNPVAEPGKTYPKRMYHPGYPNGAAHGLLVKDYRGKDAKQEIWKFDGGSISKIIDALKQAAIEEGQWNEKRDFSATVGLALTTAKLHAGRERVAAAKRAADEAAKQKAIR